MPPKRSSPSEELTGRERKKQKTAVARTIAVQSDHGASKGAGTAEAGPSKSVRFDSKWPQFMVVAVVLAFVKV